MPTGLIGIAVILLVAFGLSEYRNKVHWRLVASTLALQFAIAIFVLITPVGQAVLSALSVGVRQIIAYADQGIFFIFGPLASPSEVGFIIAIQVLPVIIFVSALISVLYHFGIMQLLVKGLGTVFQRLLGVPRLEAVCASANIFVGMVEAPLTIRPYLTQLTRSQIFSVMCTGLATVAGSILVGYASLGIDIEYLLTAAFMGAPGGLLMAKILIPETETAFDPAHEIEVDEYGAGEKPVNFIEAAAVGAMVGLKLSASVAGLLLAFVALVALANGVVGGIGGIMGYADVSLELLIGYAFAPVSFLIGIPWTEAITTGNYLGQKIILNEFLAFASFAPVKAEYSEKTQAILSITLCGFANLSSMAILLGGIGSLVPERRSEIASLGLKAVLAGTLANLLSGAIAGVLLTVAQWW